MPMSLEWRVRHELARRRSFALIPFPLLVAALVAFGLGWGVSRREASDVLAAMTAPFKNASEDESVKELQMSRSELDSAHQEIEYMNRQVQAANAALIAANEELLKLQGELASAGQKLTDASAERDEVRRQVAELCAPFGPASQAMPLPCRARKPR